MSEMKKKQAPADADGSTVSIAEAAEKRKFRRAVIKFRSNEDLKQTEINQVDRYEASRIRKAIEEADQRRNLTGLCNLTGYSRHTLRDWEMEGMPRNPDRTFCVPAVLQWIFSRLRGQAQNRSEDTEELERKIKVQILDERERNNARERGDLVEREKCIRVIEEQSLNLREGMQDMDERVAMKIGDSKTPEERRAILEDEHRKLADTYAAGLAEML